MLQNGMSTAGGLHRADEAEELIDLVKSLIIPFIKDADNAASQPDKSQSSSDLSTRTALVHPLEPHELLTHLNFSLPTTKGKHKAALQSLITSTLSFSVNPWHQGFLSKLYSSPSPLGPASDLLLSTLNTNSHVYQVSPALTVIEKSLGSQLAKLFGLPSPHAGGFTTQGGSASNLTSLVVARNHLHPSTKSHASPLRFALFTSSHGHYSLSKAAMICGMGGSEAVVSVPASDDGRMDPAALRRLIAEAKSSGKTPLYVNATAGTTVYGSFDPFPEIAEICEEAGVWFHVDAAWGGGVVFSERLRGEKLKGVERADSIAFNPHKMLNVPLTCSFLLGRDLRVFREANSLPAEYLFHGEGEEEGETWDLAELTLQCGRRADALKLALAWTYYGSDGFGEAVEGAFELAADLATRLEKHNDFWLVSSCPPPCLQVCFYYTPAGRAERDGKVNTWRTKEMVSRLVRKGFMIDHAPGPCGNFIRVVINIQTLETTIKTLVAALEKVGKEVMKAEALA